MKIQLLLLILLGTALVVPDSSADLKAIGGVIYNEAGLDMDSTQLSFPILGLTFEIRLDTVPGFTPIPPGMARYSLDTAGNWGAPKPDTTYLVWNLYVTQTLPDTVRRFRVVKLEPIEESMR